MSSTEHILHVYGYDKCRHTQRALDAIEKHPVYKATNHVVKTKTLYKQWLRKQRAPFAQTLVDSERAVRHKQSPFIVHGGTHADGTGGTFVGNADDTLTLMRKSLNVAPPGGVAEENRRHAFWAAERAKYGVRDGPVAAPTSAVDTKAPAGERMLRDGMRWIVAGDVLHPTKAAGRVAAMLRENGRTVACVNPRDRTGKVHKDVRGAVAALGDAASTVLDLCIRPETGLEQLRAAADLGVRQVFIQPGAGSSAILVECNKRNIAVHEGNSAGTADAAAVDSYEYDVVVIGGGSGGLACAKEAAEAAGKRVAVLDYVTPSPAGSVWGLGGTCVNVGCIPKKLMHAAALLGEARQDQHAFGWNLRHAAHNWATLRDNVQAHIRNMNAAYAVQLESKKVKYYNARGKFLDPHTVQIVYGNGSTEAITAQDVVVAVGGRPNALQIPGGEFAISSDDLFMLPKPPGKTLVVGASYVALECAGFLTGLGYDTTCAVRSILLRGFDQDCADRIGAYMAASGTKFLRSVKITKIDKLPTGRLLVHWSGRQNWAKLKIPQPPHHGGVLEVDTVLAAIGRSPVTGYLNLDAAGVVSNPEGFLPTRQERTNVPHVYGIGDVIREATSSVKLELTPVAIQTGKLLARRLVGLGTETMDYERVATTVFTPIEYAHVGVTEDALLQDTPRGAAASTAGGLSTAYTAATDGSTHAGVPASYAGKHLPDNYEVHRKTYTPLEWSIVKHRAELPKCYMKVICDNLDDGRVLGIHVLGPNAGEIVQGFGLAIRLGMTYADLTDTVGIHPTSAEHLTIIANKPPPKPGQLVENPEEEVCET